MDKKKSLPLVLLVVACIVVAVVFLFIRYYPRTSGVIRVPQDYLTIQRAINASRPGDTISVASGTYVEAIYINKDNLTLIGENKSDTIIEGPPTGPVVWLEAASNVNITGFTVRLSCPTCYGFYIKLSQKCFIYENVITENNRGIYVTSCTEINISNNTITNNSGNGIEIHYSQNIILRGNELVGNKRNLAVFGTMLSQFTHDIDVSNSVNGKPVYYWVNQSNMIVPQDAGYVAAVNCANITVKNLTLSDNGQGVLLAYTNSSTITNVSSLNNFEGISLHSSFHNNICNNNVSFNRDGVCISWSSNNSISLNNIQQSIYDGVYMERADNNTVQANNVSSNTVGIYSIFSSDNAVFHNNFINNTDQVESYNSINTWDDGYPSGGNYWSDYMDVDEKSGPNQDEAGSDGIGDTYYVIDENNRDRYPLMNPYV